MKNLTELERKIYEAIMSRLGKSTGVSEAAKAIATLIEQEREKAFYAARANEWYEADHPRHKPNEDNWHLKYTDYSDYIKENK